LISSIKSFEKSKNEKKNIFKKKFFEGLPRKNENQKKNEIKIFFSKIRKSFHEQNFSNSWEFATTSSSSIPTNKGPPTAARPPDVLADRLPRSHGPHEGFVTQ